MKHLLDLCFIVYTELINKSCLTARTLVHLVVFINPLAIITGASSPVCSAPIYRLLLSYRPSLAANGLRCKLHEPALRLSIKVHYSLH